MYCKAGVQCTNPEVYGDIKRGRRLAPSKGLVCPRCQGKCCNEACLEKHKCKQRARPSSSVAGGMRAGQHARWQGLDPSTMIDPTTGLLDPNMQLALARAGQGGLLLPQAGGNMMPVIPILPFPFMLNAAALQQAGVEGGLDAAQLQAALAAAGAMGAGGMSAPMMLAPMGNQGGDAASMSQALQLAQLQAAGLGGPLLQLTVQPDGMVSAGNGQRMALPPGLMQGMPLQLPGGALQFLSAEQLQGLGMGADAGGGMQLMQVMADGTTQVDQAAMNAALTAAAAGGLDANLMAGLTAMGANLAGLAGVSGSDAQAFLEQQQQQLELNVAAAAAAAAEGLPAGMGGEGGAEDPSAAEAAAAAAAMQAGGYGAEGDGGLADANALAASAAAQSAELQQLIQQQQEQHQQQQQLVADSEAAAAAAAASNPDGAAPNAEALPAGADGSSGLVLPGIAPLHMAPELAAALNAASGGRGLYNAEEDTAAAALMSLATDKKNKAAAAAAAAQAAAVAANEGIIPQAVAAQAIEQARQLQAEAEAEAEAEARAQQQQQQQQQQLLQDAQAQQQQQQHVGDAGAGGVAMEGVKLEELQFAGMSHEQLQELQLQLLQQQQIQMFQHQQQQQQQAQEQLVKFEQEQAEHYLQQQQHHQQQQQLEAQAQHDQSALEQQQQQQQNHYEQA